MNLDSALLAQIEAQIAKRAAENRLTDYRPYAKQREFHAAGATHRERLLKIGRASCRERV